VPACEPLLRYKVRQRYLPPNAGGGTGRDKRPRPRVSERNSATSARQTGQRSRCSSNRRLSPAETHNRQRTTKATVWFLRTT
jgi:hypothetical protein